MLTFAGLMCGGVRASPGGRVERIIVAGGIPSTDKVWYGIFASAIHNDNFFLTHKTRIYGRPHVPCQGSTYGRRVAVATTSS